MTATGDSLFGPGFADFVPPYPKLERVRSAYELPELSLDEEEAIIETRRQRRADASANEFDWGQP